MTSRGKFINPQNASEAHARAVEALEAGNVSQSVAWLCDAVRMLTGAEQPAPAESAHHGAPCPACDGRTITGPWTCPRCGVRYGLDAPHDAPCGHLIRDGQTTIGACERERGHGGEHQRGGKE